ncbi:hypothetical protein TVAG_409680 [Trichomonas vaginalis G3]|uniref:Uncharacterized protein n=1 Tax=Trichomonas vaginalis (strain ATCC PRA-98 / G3) TaxID=412133 RepID=A2F8C8_TRIV3|nr:hypothetical protein TVAGG3_0365630 [Trichomonas vaginalis G3]EAX98830.1 hypothetical protein TVAG_409680 [Trichomonas vaginalis G3]KAI5532248.1 hypothetical protein TVAGG3_0365630 [Trichomonas vaginalis G3]|eukprot:XP_001311760.1 hypothetical protein [Trichomonas vaginalis G3]
MNDNNYNWWRQSLSPTIQMENNLQNDTDGLHVLGYENVSVHMTTRNWGGLCLTNSNITAFINGDVSRTNWYYAIGSYGTEKNIPAYGAYLKQVALYAKIPSLDMIICISCQVYRNLFLNFPEFLFVIIV